MDTKRYEKEDILINFRDMLLYILLRWRSILAGVLLLTVLAGGYKYWQDYRHYQSRLAAAEQEKQAGADLREEALAKAGIALDYQRAYDNQAAYNAAAPLMHIDPNAAPTTVFSAVITGTKGHAAGVLYQNLLGDDITYAAIAEELDWKQSSYVADLVEITREDERAATGLAGDDGYAVLQLRIQAPTKEQCGTIEAALRKRLTALKAVVTQAAGAHSVTLAGPSFSLLVDTELKNTQQGHINNCNTMRTNLETAISGLSDEERAYLDQLNAEAQAPTDQTPTVVPPSISKKYLVLGFGGGLVLFAVIYAVGYLFNKRLRSQTDFSQRYALPLFGVLRRSGCQKRRCGIDRWLLRRFYKQDYALKPEEAVRLLSQQVLLTARKAGVRVLYVTGCALTQSDEQQLLDMAKALEAAGIRLEMGSCPLYDADSMQRMADADALLLAETVDASTYNDMHRELALAEQLGIRVLGAIILR